VDGWTDGRTDVWTDGRTDRTEFQFIRPSLGDVLKIGSPVVTMANDNRFSCKTTVAELEAWHFM